MQKYTVEFQVAFLAAVRAGEGKRVASKDLGEMFDCDAATLVDLVKSTELVHQISVPERGPGMGGFGLGASTGVSAAIVEKCQKTLDTMFSLRGFKPSLKVLAETAEISEREAKSALRQLSQYKLDSTKIVFNNPVQGEQNANLSAPESGKVESERTVSAA